jgi:hypothetical protein
MSVISRVGKGSDSCVYLNFMDYKIHCRLDPRYPPSFAAASSMSRKAVHPRHLDIGSH